MCDDPLLDVNQLCAWLNVQKTWVYDMTMTRRIPHVKIAGRQLRFDRKQIQVWLAEREKPAETRLPSPGRRRTTAA